MRLIPSAADRRVLDERRGTRAMLWIMAIMLFLTVLAAALGLGTARAAALVDRQLAGRLTVQVVEANAAARDAQARAALAALRANRDVNSATLVSRDELARMIRPWLGADGADPDLPIPALIDVDLRASDEAALAQVIARVKAVAPAARIDRHERWMSPVAQFMDGLIWAAAGLVLLMAAATMAVVLLAARAGLDLHRDTIGVLHILGSTDVQIARLFQRRIGLDTLLGGALGTALALGMVALAAGRIGALGSDLVAGATLGPVEWAALALLPLLFALLATLAARVAVLGALRNLL